MAQAYADGETELFDTREEAAEDLENYARTRGTCFYEDNELQRASVDGAVVEITEYEEKWGYDVLEKDCVVTDIGESVIDHLTP